MMGDYYLYKLPCELLNNSRLLSKLETENETQRTPKSPTNTTPNNAPHPTMDPTMDDPPTLTPDEIDNQSTPDKNNFSDDSMDQSPQARIQRFKEVGQTD